MSVCTVRVKVSFMVVSLAKVLPAAGLAVYALSRLVVAAMLEKGSGRVMT